MKHQGVAVSVVLPVYNGEATINEAVASVLNQTYADFELIVVDDASQDSSVRIISRINDARLKLVRRRRNGGASQSRLTGVMQARGEAIAFLDQDDLFRPDKLERHMSCLGANPDVGVTYNGHYEVFEKVDYIRQAYVPPSPLKLEDVVCGFPLSPSGVVMRARWARASLPECAHLRLWHGGEIVWFGRLLLQGCRFAHVDELLSYRRLRRRVCADSEQLCRAYQDAQNLVLSDARAPQALRKLKHKAHARAEVIAGCHAILGGRDSAGRRHIERAVQLDGSLIDGEKSELMHTLVDFSLDNEPRDFTAALSKLLAGRPATARRSPEIREWAVARGHLLMGVRHMLWGRPERATDHLEDQTLRRVGIDEEGLAAISGQLMGYECHVGEGNADAALSEVAERIRATAIPCDISRLLGRHKIGRAFRHYSRAELAAAWRSAIAGLLQDPRYCLNRGVWSITLRAIIGSLFRSGRGKSRTDAARSPFSAAG